MSLILSQSIMMAESRRNALVICILLDLPGNLLPLLRCVILLLAAERLGTDEEDDGEDADEDE